jgi:DNA polymerase-3 subunit epsilon
MMSLAEAENVLATSPDHRVLRRFVPRPEYGLLTDPRVGVFVDVESTGLNTEEDKIIQIALVRFQFDPAGNIGMVGPVYCGFEDPGAPLAADITEITGITDAMLKGQRLDEKKIGELLTGADLMIAHNADFDRKMIERRIKGADRIAWGCSQRDVKWERFGSRGMKLDYLLMTTCGEFYDAHDALRDCLAGVHVLATPRMMVGQTELSPFQCLLESVRQPTYRLWAWQSPFSTKERLRLRKYRWNAEKKVWTKDLKAEDLPAEQDWLRENVYGGHTLDDSDPSRVTKISAFDRYSVRAA